MRVLKERIGGDLGFNYVDGHGTRHMTYFREKLEIPEGLLSVTKYF